MLSSIRHTAHLLFALSFATTIFASERVVQVPLTDPGIVLGGHTQYNASLCGGGISLPTLGDSLAFQFNGSDIQLDFVVLPKEDNGNFTAWPDEALTSSGDSTPWDHPQSLNCTFRRSTSFSSAANYQLKQGVHTLNLTNTGASYGGGGILVVGISYFPDPLPSTFDIWVPESQRPGSGTSIGKGVILGATFASVIGFGLLASLGEYLHRRYRRNRQAKNASAESVELNNLGSDGTTPNDPKPTVSRSGYRLSRWLDSLFRVV